MQTLYANEQSELDESVWVLKAPWKLKKLAKWVTDIDNMEAKAKSSEIDINKEYHKNSTHLKKMWWDCKKIQRITEHKGQRLGRYERYVWTFLEVS